MRAVRQGTRAKANEYHRSEVRRTRRRWKYSAIILLDVCPPGRKSPLDDDHPPTCHYGARWPSNVRLTSTLECGEGHSIIYLV